MFLLTPFLFTGCTGCGDLNVSLKTSTKSSYEETNTRSTSQQEQLFNNHFLQQAETLVDEFDLEQSGKAKVKERLRNIPLATWVNGSHTSNFYLSSKNFHSHNGKILKNENTQLSCRISIASGKITITINGFTKTKKLN